MLMRAAVVSGAAIITGIARPKKDAARLLPAVSSWLIVLSWKSSPQTMPIIIRGAISAIAAAKEIVCGR